ncbi:MAG: nitrate ABC transporter substrate-binding protein, partial [Betaproteobacteria bacterium]|nr:nitrate ABC transporter substrate-binding protein [Betaproteobacteria bacterium]
MMASLALASWCVAGVAASQTVALEKVTLASWGKPISEVTNILVEEDKGFFRNRGIDLSFMPGAGGGDAIRNLLSGQA